MQYPSIIIVTLAVLVGNAHAVGLRSQVAKKISMTWETNSKCAAWCEPEFNGKPAADVCAYMKKNVPKCTECQPCKDLVNKQEKKVWKTSPTCKAWCEKQFNQGKPVAQVCKYLNNNVPQCADCEPCEASTAPPPVRVSKPTTFHFAAPGATSNHNKNPSPICTIDSATDMGSNAMWAFVTDIAVQCCKNGNPIREKKTAASRGFIPWSFGNMKCTKAKSYDQALQICTDLGVDLCDVREIDNDQGKGQGCGFDNHHVWTKTPCQLNNIVEVNGAGKYGGPCTCPDGEVMYAGDSFNDCGSLECYNGIAGECKKWPNVKWSGKKVTCKKSDEDLAKEKEAKEQVKKTAGLLPNLLGFLGPEANVLETTDQAHKLETAMEKKVTSSTSDVYNDLNGKFAKEEEEIQTLKTGLKKEEEEIRALKKCAKWCAKATKPSPSQVKEGKTAFQICQYMAKTGKNQCAGCGQCQADTVDDCANSPCQNGGKCIDGHRSYKCECVAGYEGENCTSCLFFAFSSSC
jgi:hypothetical protein